MRYLISKIVNYFRKSSSLEVTDKTTFVSGCPISERTGTVDGQKTYMSPSSVSKKSLREHVFESIGNFLFTEHLPFCSITQLGILNLIDLVSNYHEEGVGLYPEIAITDNIESLLAPIPFIKMVEIGSKKLEVEEFENVLKLCAPLAKDGWVIFIEVKEGVIRYGLASAEISEISPSFYRQIMGDLRSEEKEAHVAYIRNVNNQSVLVEGNTSKLLVSLTLKEVSGSASELNSLCEYISTDVPEETRNISLFFLEKVIDDALKNGHGALIAVVKDTEGEIEKIKSILENGVYFHKPIDFIEHLQSSETERTREASTATRSFSSLVKSMICHDGITIFSTKGRVLGYHCFIREPEIPAGEVIGGGRSIAFEMLSRSKKFCCCFYKSQDGKEKIWTEKTKA